MSATRTVLVVDDNVRLTKALAALLRDAGYEPVVYHNGADTLAYSDGATPAVALIDIHLPDICGLVLAAKLRQKYGPALPIVIVSGDTSMETINTLSHIGATYFFPKPVRADYLIERLREWAA
jgi:DNA-binding response OmpR family regulator